MIKKAVSLYLLGYVLFCFVGYMSYDADDKQSFKGWVHFSDRDFTSGSWSMSSNNYSSEKFAVANSDIRQSSFQSQKFEKIASMGASTVTFEESVDSLKSLIKEYNSIVQFEENSGLVGERNIKLTIGVDPARFEEMVAQLKNVGKLMYFRSDVTDKTNEFRELQAKRKTLETHLVALQEFKSRDGEIDDLMGLQGKILGVQEQLQALGVSLGDFDSENEFCTIKMSMKELIKEEVKSDFWSRVEHSLVWALGKYSWLTLLAAAFAAIFWVLVKAVDLARTKQDKPE